MNSPRRPWWQQATALVSLSAGGAVTGFAFVPGTADHVASPASIPVTLTALEHSARPAASDDSAARAAIVSVTNYYLRMAQSKTPAEMEALIWQRDSKDGADHGESCAAFASMTLALAAQLIGRQSWVTGGSTYPWPLQDWADVRVDPNPASPGIISILQDAQAHQRWHPLRDGYQPLPGDWVLFDGHVEVVTSYSGGVLSTVGGDSLPNFSVNAHEYPGPLAAQGVAGFVSNGNLPAASGSATASSPAPASPGTGTSAAAPARSGPSSAAGSNSGAAATQQAVEQPAGALAAVPGTVPVTSDASASMLAEGAVIPGIPQAPAVTSGGGRSSKQAASHQAAAAKTAAQQATASQRTASRAASPQAAAPQTATSHISAEAAIPGMPDTAATDGPAQPSATTDGPAQPSATTDGPAQPPAAASTGHQPAPVAAPAAASGPGTPAQQAFIDQVAPGAIAAQRTYGVPAAVTIAQAIEESGWGQSTLAVQDHNLFGIKGAGPAGGDSYPTQEFQTGQWVTTTAQFRAYDDIAQSIEDHGKLLATSGYYTAAMAVRQTPDSFAQALTGVYATDPSYGTNLISLMQRFNLYRFGASSQPAAPARTAPGTATAQATASARPSATPSALRPRAAVPRATTGGPTVSPKPVIPSTTAPPPAVAPSSAVRPPTAKPSATATAPALASPHRAVSPSAAASPNGPASPRPAHTPSVAVSPPRATAPSAPASSRGAPAAPSRPVPHPFATPQPAGPASPGTPPDQAAIPGIPSGPGTTSAHTSAHVRSSAGSGGLRSPSDTEVVAELAAVYRHDPPPGKPAAAKGPDSRSPGRKPSAGASLAKRATADRSPAQKKPTKRKGAPAKARRPAPRYQPQMPPRVKNAFLASAKKPLARAELIYRDVAGTCGISWKLLAACDWMQCEAHPRYSPVQGEKLGTLNADGTVFRTKSEALTQCARDLVTVADTVYQIDLTLPVELSVLELARVFAAFRWGGLLRLHDTSAMEFPYSVQGLTEQHANMRWPRIAEPNAPDKPGARFRRPFGAVPVVLSLDYPATVLAARARGSKGRPMVRLLILVVSSLVRRRLVRAEAAWAGPGVARGWYPPEFGHDGYDADSSPTQVLPPRATPRPREPGSGYQRTPGTGSRPPYPPRPRRRWVPRWVKWSAAVVLVGLIFRRVIASVVLMALSATFHFLGLNVHLPHVRFAWPWQTITAGSTTNAQIGPWVLQKIEGISKPALGTENFNFVFTHKVSKDIGPWPCWYSSTFYAVGHASATVNLNPGPSWWTAASGHYRLQVLSEPQPGKPGHVAVAMILPPPQLPQSARDVTIDNTLSRPLDTQHSWTYPGLGCGALIRPQFAQSVLYAEAQDIAFYRVNHVSQVTAPLISAAETEASQMIRGNFIQPTVNAFGYTLDSFTLHWSAAP